VVGRVGLPKTLVKPERVRAVKKRANFILVLRNWSAGMGVCRGAHRQGSLVSVHLA
jgi:hypothetical protein